MTRVLENLTAVLFKISIVHKSKWIKEGDDVEASLKKDGKEHKVIIDAL